MSNVAICHVSFAIKIGFNNVKDIKILKIAKVEHSKESRPTAEMKSVFSDNLSQNVQSPVYEIE